MCLQILPLQGCTTLALPARTPSRLRPQDTARLICHIWDLLVSFRHIAVFPCTCCRPFRLCLDALSSVTGAWRAYDWQIVFGAFKTVTRIAFSCPQRHLEHELNGSLSLHRGHHRSSAAATPMARSCFMPHSCPLWASRDMLLKATV